MGAAQIAFGISNNAFNSGQRKKRTRHKNTVFMLMLGAVSFTMGCACVLTVGKKNRFRTISFYSDTFYDGVAVLLSFLCCSVIEFVALSV